MIGDYVGIDPDGHRTILFRYAHKLAGAAGHASTVVLALLRATGLRRFDSRESKAGGKTQRESSITWTVQRLDIFFASLKIISKRFSIPT